MFSLADLDEQPKNRQSILLIEGLSRATVLGVVVNDVDLGIVGNPINMMFTRVTTNGTSVTPRYEVVAKMVYYIYDDTW